jgi:hypothetical protein
MMAISIPRATVNKHKEMLQQPVPSSRVLEPTCTCAVMTTAETRSSDEPRNVRGSSATCFNLSTRSNCVPQPLGTSSTRTSSPPMYVTTSKSCYCKPSTRKSGVQVRSAAVIDHDCFNVKSARVCINAQQALARQLSQAPCLSSGHLWSCQSHLSASRHPSAPPACPSRRVRY